VKLTLDSSEPLKDAMRVVGALYGVKLVLAREVPQPGAPVDETEPDTQGQPSQGGDPVAARKPRRNRRTATGDKTRPSKPASSARSGFPRTGAEPEVAEQNTAAEPPGAVSNADVRAWARQNAVSVSDRGRVPASVLSAYRKAHGE